MLRPVRFDPSHPAAQLAVHRLQRFHSIALKHVDRYLRALIVNDGIAFVREMSPRSKSVTFDFIARVFAAFQAINAEDRGSQHPGDRCIVAAGARLRTAEPMKLNPRKLASILSRHRDGDISCEQAITEAFSYGPPMSNMGSWRNTSDRILPRHHMATTRTIPAPFSEYLTVEQVATILQVSTNTALRRFGNMEGVIDLGTPETLHKRRKRILRIPRQTLERFIAERQVRHRR
jgi:hypothetical protein